MLLTGFLQQGTHRGRQRDFCMVMEACDRKIDPWFLVFTFSAIAQGCSVQSVQLGAAALSFHITRKPAALHHFLVMLNSRQLQKTISSQLVCFAWWTECYHCELYVCLGFPLPTLSTKSEDFCMEMSHF